MRTRNITILGSTGSIGNQTLDVVRESNNSFNVLYLTTNRKIQILEAQVKEFQPKGVVIYDFEAYTTFKNSTNFKGEILYGEDALCQVASAKENEIIVSAIVGFSGIKPTLSALKAGKIVALANKETIVALGKHIKQIASEHGAKIISIDSEHNAIFQCLLGENPASIEKIILTASGGPFLNFDPSNFDSVQVEEALAHPKWNMGKKISIDSATLMNKGLEVIEARWLFDIPTSKIQVLIHPESVIHSLVQFVDGSLKAQLGEPDMRIPISFALNYPQRMRYNFPRLDLVKTQRLTFYEPDTSKFPCLRLAYEVLEEGGSAPIVLNTANEIAVESFLEGKISFSKIPISIEYALSKVEFIQDPTIEEIFLIDDYTRKITKDFINKSS
ncbi:MAG: 1-deoxy-D-xylulose-5-phosphate reductoisomerase [Candidatus Kapaibacteriales bacterium]